MSFSWLGIFRQGAWKDFRRFVLEERRDVGNRLAVIRSELIRIGYVVVKYEAVVDENENIVVTEKRTGFAVPPRSSLGKLIQAYVVAGGNPLSISHFLIPDQNTSSDGVVTKQYPAGGVVYPLTGDMGTTQYDGGFKSIGNDPAKRTGGRKRHATERVDFHVDHSRRWVTQEIREKRNNIEARIIKLVDLREQLKKEVIQLTLAVGGTIGELPVVDRTQYEVVFNTASLIHFLDQVFYEDDADGVPDMSVENTAALAYYPFLMSDEDFEVGTEL